MGCHNCGPASTSSWSDMMWQAQKLWTLGGKVNLNLNHIIIKENDTASREREREREIV